MPPTPAVMSQSNNAPILWESLIASRPQAARGGVGGGLGRGLVQALRNEPTSAMAESADRSIPGIRSELNTHFDTCN